jgi:hypothetical protein
MFKDISNFNNTSDYLSMLNGTLITELIVFIYIILNNKRSKNVKLWYNKFSISAVICDILSVFIGFIIVRYLYTQIFNSFNIIYFILLGIGFQLTHDILFYYFFKNIEYGKNSMLDVFKDYAKEMGIKILFYDSILVISTVLFASLFAYKNTNINIIVLVVLLYLLPYFYTNI